jgi:hypothetical protein
MLKSKHLSTLRSKEDAIFDYSSSFDTSPYVTEVAKDWEDNQSDAYDIRFDLLWRGTPRAEPPIHSASSTPGISGWDVGTWKRLDLWNFQSVTHKLLHDVKRTFNLPDQEDGEFHYLWWDRRNREAMGMVMSHPTKGGFMSTNDNMASNNQLRCGLVMPIKGFSFYGGKDNEESMVVCPGSTDIDTMNAHYVSLEYDNTPAAGWTDPPKVGPEFISTSSLFLLNFENYWKGEPSFTPTPTLTLDITWSSHSYAEIKALIDAAVA